MEAISKTDGMTMAARNSIRFVSGGLDQHKVGEDTHLVLRAVLDPTSLDLLEVDTYQRETLTQKIIEGLVEPVLSGAIPDIVLGVRGAEVNEREGAYFVKAPAYIIDGYQRVTAARYALRTQPGCDPRLGCLVFFNTNADFERQLFIKLNTTALKLSPNVVLRDLAPDFPVLGDLLGLTTANKGFPLYDRVCWTQRMNRNELINARTFCLVVGHLHSKLASTKASDVRTVAAGLQKLSDKIGNKLLLANTTTFFEIVDQCFGLRRISFKQTATQIKGNFLQSLARVFYSFPNIFWQAPTRKAESDGLRSKLEVPALWLQRLRTFPIQDGEVVRLSAAGSSAGPLLYMMMLEHLNKGRRTNRLIDPCLTEIDADPDNGDEDGAAAE